MTCPSAAPRPLARLTGFLRDPAGGATAYGLLLMFALLVSGGYAVDVQNVFTARTKLQTAADSAAHAALLTRESRSADEARQAAVDVANLNMPPALTDSTLTIDDVVFGDWDEATRSFTPDPDSRGAVKVTAWRTNSRGNSIGTYLLKLVGNDSWNVSVSSIYVTYHPTCLREGFVAQDVVDLRSNNSFTSGFCIHSNAYVSLNSNNYFEPGTVVSMADLDDIDLPNSGYKTNEGLEQALREGSWNIRMVSRIDDIIAGLSAMLPDHRPAYIATTVFSRLPSATVLQSHLTEGRPYRFTCNAPSGRLTFDNNITVRNVVIVTNCQIFFRNGVKLENAVLATTNTGSKSIASASGSTGLTVGRNDNCAPGGDVQLLTRGSMDFPSKLSVFNGQFLAMGNIAFAANADGVKGIAMVAGGGISGTSNMTMAFCGRGMENNFHAEYFRMVE